jgi:hypothetical protein
MILLWKFLRKSFRKDLQYRLILPNRNPKEVIPPREFLAMSLDINDHVSIGQCRGPDGFCFQPG